MKIGILTFHAADNYGAVLQAYGLREVLAAEGHDVYVVDYRPEYLTAPYRVILPSALSSLRRAARAVAVAPLRAVRRGRFERFVRTRLNLLDPERVGEMDVLVAGSDQIWNPMITGGQYDAAYFLASPAMTGVGRRVSYAASAGSGVGFGKRLTGRELEWLQGLDAVSVREESLARELVAAGVKAEVVADPVLLAGRDVFERLTDRSLVPTEPYVVAFSLTHNPRLTALAAEIANRGGMRLVDMFSNDESVFHRGLVQTAPVERFVSLLRYASGVVTTSFHGTAFAVLFNRPFVSVGCDERHGERARMMLGSLGLASHYHTLDDISAGGMQLEADFKEAEQRLEMLRLRSQLFINQQITPPPDTYLR